MHHISRLQYKVACPDEGQAFELRNLLSAVATECLAAKMEDISDRYVADDSFVRIPRLEISLQISSLNFLSEEISILFGNALEDELRKLAAGQGDVPDWEQEAEAVFYFLKNGTLPQWAVALGMRINAIMQHVISRRPEKLLAFLYANGQDQNIWNRILLQLPELIRAEIICLVPELNAQQERLKKDLAEWHIQNTTLNIVAKQEAIPGLIIKSILEHASGAISGVFAHNGLLGPFLLNAGVGTIPVDETIHMPYMPPILSLAFHEPQVPADVVFSTESDGSIVPAIPALSDIAATSGVDEKLVTHTSGIVLLYPFLKPFFTELELLREGQWKDADAQVRAVHLLHHLATGVQEQPEWNLVLEKFMCGLRPEIPIERQLRLSDAEMAECESLLSSVIEHWLALKNTSPRGLRETFLRRDGLLRPTDKGYRLQVARKTQDVLLDALPWTFYIIKPAWNDYLIEVLW